MCRSSFLDQGLARQVPPVAAADTPGAKQKRATLQPAMRHVPRDTGQSKQTQGQRREQWQGGRCVEERRGPVLRSAAFASISVHFFCGDGMWTPCSPNPRPLRVRLFHHHLLLWASSFLLFRGFFFLAYHHENGPALKFK